MLRAVAVGLFAVMMLASFAPSAAAWEPAAGGTFNNPKGTKAAKWRIVNKVNQAIRNAPRGSRIMISTYLMDSRASADALIGAWQRGVQVQIVMDGDDADTRTSRRIANRLNEDNGTADPSVPVVEGEEPTILKWGPDQSFVVFCDGSCRGGRADNHAKFYVFTQTGTASNVIMVSSSNLNGGGASLGWNDLYTVKNNAPMLETYSNVHAEMAQDTAVDGDGYIERHHGPYTSRFFPMNGGTDPVQRDLDEVRCHGATGGAGAAGRTRINISMFWWAGTRGEQLARQLISLGGAGCKISIIYGAPSRIVAGMLKKAAANGKIRLWDSRYDRNGDGIMDLRVHHKYMLINGVYGGDSSSWRVHTGSQNWGHGSLRHGDENTLNVDSRAAYGQYLNNWNYIAKRGARRIG